MQSVVSWPLAGPKSEAARGVPRWHQLGGINSQFRRAASHDAQNVGLVLQRLHFSAGNRHRTAMDPVLSQCLR